MMNDETPTDCPLTARDLEVIALLGEGLQVRTIAKKVGLSQYYVNTIIRKIMDKLDLRSSTGIVGMAYRCGWLPTDRFIATDAPAAVLYNGKLIVVHPGMPPHVWDGEKMTRLDLENAA